MAEPMELCSSDQNNPLKRPCPEDEPSKQSISMAQSAENSDSIPTPPLTASPKHDTSNRDPSPAPSNSTLSSVATSTLQENPAGSSAPPQKRRKLTPAEKEQQRQEKEQKKRERDEQRAKRDEEKRVKDEERRKKKEEKEVKDRERELEKQRKEHEKQKKEEERIKKEKSQPKLASFFAKPKLPAISSVSPSKTIATETSNLASTAVDTAEDSTTSLQDQTPPRLKQERSDYERKFLPFQLPSYTTLAPYLSHSIAAAEARQTDFDDLIQRVLNSEDTSDGPISVASFFNEERGMSRGLWQPNAREIMESLDGSSQSPIDLTDESGEKYCPEDLLRCVTIRHLHFAEDVRPPYSGSYTKSLSPRSSRKLRRRPFSRLRKDTNYDYDSEAEWEEPEEGEDLLSDGEDDEESVGAPDEMEDFLDEDEAGPRRRLITGDLQPISTGLCWEVSPTKGLTAQELPVDMDSMKLEFFLDLPQSSIDPFSTAYWPKEGTRPPATTAPTLSETKAVMQLGNGKIISPRPPLQPRLSTNGASIIGACSGTKGPIMIDRSTKAAKPGVKPLEGRDLNEFREAVVGSNVPKTDLLKALKKRFPKFTNDIIKSTLSERFEFAGITRAEKTWTYLG